MAMNDIMRALFGRISTRRFEQEPVTEEQRRQIVGAALQAPSARNQTAYTILDITEQAL